MQKCLPLQFICYAGFSKRVCMSSYACIHRSIIFLALVLFKNSDFIHLDTGYFYEKELTISFEIFMVGFLCSLCLESQVPMILIFLPGYSKLEVQRDPETEEMLGQLFSTSVGFAVGFN